MRPTDKELVETLRELTGDDDEFYNELVSAYITNLVEFKEEASLSVRELDLASLKEHLHKINPTLLTLKYDQEYEELVKIKQHLNEESMEENLQKIKLITQRAIIQLEDLKVS